MPMTTLTSHTEQSDDLLLFKFPFRTILFTRIIFVSFADSKISHTVVHLDCNIQFNYFVTFGNVWVSQSTKWVKNKPQCKAYDQPIHIESFVTVLAGAVPDNLSFVLLICIAIKPGTVRVYKWSRKWKVQSLPDKAAHGSVLQNNIVSMLFQLLWVHWYHPQVGSWWHYIL